MRNPRIAPVLLGVLLLTCGPGCRQATDTHSHGSAQAGTHDHDHDHEPKTAQITVWTDRYEVFAEHRAPVANRPTTFVTHITDLRTSEPLREGPVRFLLRREGVVVEHLQVAPARDGIYLPGLTFPGAGDWRVTLSIPVDATQATVDLGTVRVHADEHAAGHAGIADSPEGVAFLKEQQWRIRSATEPVARRRLVERLRVPARVRAKPGLKATLSASVPGQLIALPGRTPPRPGQRVVSGEVLALIRPGFSEAGAKVAEATAEFASAKAALEQAEAALRRIRRLAADQAKSARELQEAELAHQSAEARYAAAAGLLATFRPAAGGASPGTEFLMELRAPIDGVLDAVAAGPGEVIAPNVPVFTVLDPGTVWIEGAVPESLLGRLGEARDASVEVPGESGRSTPVTGADRGRLLSIGLEVDAATRTVPILYETSNREGHLRVGQAITLLVETTRSENAVVVPEGALVEEGDQWVAFVQVGGETFQKRDIRTGVRDSGFVQVLDGLREGERVVTRGAYALRLSSVSGAIPAHGHTH